MTDEEIIQWLTDHEVIGTWKMWIAEDVVIENGEVHLPINCYLGMRGIADIPFKFGAVEGFDISGNPLVSLHNCPIEVHGKFDVGNCPITTLEGGPKIVNGGYIANSCNSLISLCGSPQRAGRVQISSKVLTAWECRYLLMTELKFNENLNINHDIMVNSPKFKSITMYEILNEGRENGIMPSELIPGKIKQLRDLS